MVNVECLLYNSGIEKKGLVEKNNQRNLFHAKLEKWFPFHGERAHSLYIRRLEVSKNNRNVKEEETEQTY